VVEAVSRHLAPSLFIFFTSMHEREVIFCNELMRRFVVVWKAGGRGSRYPTLSAKSAERMEHPQLWDDKDFKKLTVRHTPEHSCFSLGIQATRRVKVHRLTRLKNETRAAQI